MPDIIPTTPIGWAFAVITVLALGFGVSCLLLLRSMHRTAVRDGEDDLVLAREPAFEDMTDPNLVTVERGFVVWDYTEQRA